MGKERKHQPFGRIFGRGKRPQQEREGGLLSLKTLLENPYSGERERGVGGGIEKERDAGKRKPNHHQSSGHKFIHKGGRREGAEKGKIRRRRRGDSHDRGSQLLIPPSVVHKRVNFRKRVSENLKSN